MIGGRIDGLDDSLGDLALIERALAPFFAIDFECFREFRVLQDVTDRAVGFPPRQRNNAVPLH